MVQINFAQKEIQCKIVYYGPGMSGKTTNLELIHQKAPNDHRGELTSIATTGERTLYFDYMPLDLGQIAGISTKFQLYTVPGQIYYKSTRRLVLQGVDGIVFVADSSAAKLRENKESLADLEDNLKEMGKTVKDVPIVIQYNKRDIEDAMPIAELEQELNPHGFPTSEAIATRGEGVFPTLKHLASIVLEAVNKGGLASTRSRSSRRPARQKQVVSAPAAVAVGASAGESVGAGGGGAPRSTGRPSGGGSPPPSEDERQAARPSRPAPAAPPPRPTPPRPMQERVVAMKDLRAGANSGKFLMIGLGVLITALLIFVVTQF